LHFSQTPSYHSNVIYGTFLDVLDDFSAPTSSSVPKKAAEPTATKVEETGDDEDLDAMLDDDFAKQLAAGMEELMGEAGDMEIF
jgi:peroxin-19